MSRFKRLKERKRKNRIKAVSCGLALTLAVGLSQGLGTYALFTDTEDVSSDLAISTGDVDIEIAEGEEGFDKTELQPGDQFTHPFKVTNNGTLRQNLKLILNISGIDNELREYITYNIKMATSKGLYISEDDGSIRNLDGSLFILEPGESIELESEVIIGNIPNNIQISVQQKVMNIEINMEATQINLLTDTINKGFYDTCKQENKFMIGSLILEAGGAIKITPADNIEPGKKATVSIEFDNGSKNGVPYLGLNSIIGILDGDLTVNLWNSDIKIVSQSGFFNGATIYKQSPGIKMDVLVDREEMSTDFDRGHHIDIQIDYDSNVYKIYRIDFRAIYAEGVQGNRLAQAKVSDVTEGYADISKGYIIENKIEEPAKEEVEVPTEPEEVEPPKEEVEEPNEQEVVEPPKGEIEEPNEQEEVEPPKEEVEVPTEPEVVEPPKEEVVEPPKQPEAIEPPKENEAIQE